MLIKIIVFDFDGTLVDSNKIKKDTFYNIFPPKYRCLINDTLNRVPETFTRLEIIKMIYLEIEKIYGIKHSNIELVLALNKYSKITNNKVSVCNEIKKAQSILKFLKQNGIKIYLSSNTPVENLVTIVKNRKWLNYFDDIFGKPNCKEQTVKNIIKNSSINSQQVLIVGDGKSDESCSIINNTQFYKIINKNSLAELELSLKLKLFNV